MRRTSAKARPGRGSASMSRSRPGDEIVVLTWLHLSPREGLRIEVDALEAVDGTPVVDVKPAIDPPA